MAKAKAGDKIKVHYTGTLETGETFDSSVGRDPLEFTLGEGQIIKGFDDAVTGMEIGEKKTVKIVSKDAYGDHNPQLTQEMPRDKFGELEPKEGMIIGFRAPGVEQDVPGMIVKVRTDTITIDFNPPLAGKDLNFEIERVE